MKHFLRGPRRRGHTLVELLVFLAIGAVVTAVAWSLLSGALRSSRDTEEKLQGVEGSLLAALHMEHDLRALFEDEDQGYPIEIDDRGGWLRFHRYGVESPDGEWDPLAVAPISYRFDATRRRIYRSQGDEPERPLPGFFEGFEARVVESGGSEAASVLIGLNGVAEHQGEEPDPAPGGDRVVLLAGYQRQAAATRSAYPFWHRVRVTNEVVETGAL